ncbi:DUF262 domain-containing protein [Shewanella insulae]|uniref:DUF262 domain-containing protein n=1 Tax=Shewanella insulae TaxID=2681496 RepID=UPI00247FDA8D|nr:DUF262 domain-containing protein [Shewanella insulae]
MSVSVATCSALQLLAGEPISASDGQQIEGRLCIPEYQRPYCWAELQIDGLLADFSLYQKETLERKALGQDRLPFYLGSVILHQQNLVDGKRLNIIDGQQRLTTLALVALLKQSLTDVELRYNTPESQQQIQHNLAYLSSIDLDAIGLSEIHITLVITQSEDDAYRFFETQNTGGVRLAGPDIIKAHHLRAVDEFDNASTDQYAARWEALRDLNPVIELLLKGRYWRHMDGFQELPTHNQSILIRNAVVTELAERTGKGEDVAFSRIQRVNQADGGERLIHSQKGYELSQPLNSGINTIHYLEYFEQLRQRYLLPSKVGKPSEFDHFYQGLVCQLSGCGYLKSLFDACLLLYLSQFGQQQLAVAAKKLFRVVYSRRVSNQQAVKERSIPAFIKGTPVLDWIAASYTPQQCFERLDAFHLEVEASNLGPEHNGVKKRFVLGVVDHFDLKVSKENLADEFGPVFSRAIRSCGEED